MLALGANAFVNQPKTLERVQRDVGLDNLIGPESSRGAA
jgi:hypothetical protein